MKNDLKKKFLDILFEPEDEPEVVEEGPISEVKPSKKPEQVIKPQETTKVPKASDVLYSDNTAEINKAFINYQDIAKPNKTVHVQTVKEEPVVDLSDTYELKRHISPIFGETEQKNNKKEETKKPSVSQAAVSPKNDYTGVVLSPIFGYDVASADKARTDFMKNKKKDSAMLREPTTVSPAKNVTVNEIFEEPISLFEEPFDADKKDEKYEEPFASEIKVIDEEGEPIEEVKEEYDEEPKAFEVNDLDDLDIYSDHKEENEVNSEDYSAGNSKGFIDDLLGDKD